jgi:hypothetical protein
MRSDCDDPTLMQSSRRLAGMALQQHAVLRHQASEARPSSAEQPGRRGLGNARRHPG